jgi:hypothetical protein
LSAACFDKISAMFVSLRYLIGWILRSGGSRIHIGLNDSEIARLGSPLAIKALAAKLARLVYRTLRFGIDFVDRGAEFYDAQIHVLQVRRLKWQAERLGFQISEIPGA